MQREKLMGQYNARLHTLDPQHCYCEGARLRHS
jgi:hypothetical protein